MHVICHDNLGYLGDIIDGEYVLVMLRYDIFIVSYRISEEKHGYRIVSYRMEIIEIGALNLFVIDAAVKGRTHCYLV